MLVVLMAAEMVDVMDDSTAVLMAGMMVGEKAVETAVELEPNSVGRMVQR
jgi:hypothetical protein